MKTGAHTQTLVILTALIAAAGPVLAMGGSSDPGYEPVFFEPSDSGAATLSLDAQFRYVARRGWAFPALPGSRRALDRETDPFLNRARVGDFVEPGVPRWYEADPTPIEQPAAARTGQGRVGLVFEPHMEYGRRSFRETTQVFREASLGGMVFGPGELAGSFSFDRLEFGMRFGLCLRWMGLSFGVDLAGLSMRLDGRLAGKEGTVDLRESISTVVCGFFAEIAPIPGTPVVSLYLRLSGWSSDAWEGSHQEYGLKLRFGGLSIFAGRRSDLLWMQGYGAQSDLTVDMAGYLLGLGVSF